jgi:HSP20 family protein
VNCDDDMLIISAETKSESKQEDKNYGRREYNCSSFTRSFNLPENAKADNIEANYKDGILNLTIPKKETKAKQSKTIPIK